MEQENQVLEYKCPSCGGGLQFEQGSQSMQCPFCESTFEVDQVVDYNAQQMMSDEPDFQWEESQPDSLSEDEQAQLKSFTCPSCAGEIVTEGTTAATFCPYCDNPTILPGRVSGGQKPDGVLPFKTSREDAKA